MKMPESVWRTCRKCGTTLGKAHFTRNFIGEMVETRYYSGAPSDQVVAIAKDAFAMMEDGEAGEFLVTGKDGLFLGVAKTLEEAGRLIGRSHECRRAGRR